MLEVRLTKTGDTYAIVLDERMIRELGIDPSKVISLTPSENGNALHVGTGNGVHASRQDETPARAVPRDEMAKIIEEVHERYSLTMKRLAE
jgi:hypothetical protein